MNRTVLGLGLLTTCLWTRGALSVNEPRGDPNAVASQQRLLSSVKQADFDTAATIARDLANESFAKRRQAFHALRKHMDEHGEPADWVGWIDVRLNSEKDPKARTLLATLRENVAPLECLKLGLKDQPEADKEPLQIVYEFELEWVFNRVVNSREIQSIVKPEDKKPSAKNPRPIFCLSALCENEAYHRAAEEQYSKVREEVLSGKVNSNSIPHIPSRGAPSLEKLQQFLKEHPDWRSFLRARVPMKDFAANAEALYLYTLGNHDDIPFLIEQIPDSALWRECKFAPLAAFLYREGTLDIPEIVGLGDVPCLNWWDTRLPGEVWRARLRQWWDREKATFRYTQNRRGGMVPLAFYDLLSGTTATAEAPEVDGFFWIRMISFHDWENEIWFVDLASGQTSLLVNGGGRRVCNYHSESLSWELENAGGPIEGIRWNDLQNRLEFTIGGDSFAIEYKDRKAQRIVPVEDAEAVPHKLKMSTIHRRGTLTYEVRGGDLYCVDEDKGTEKRLLQYGYILGFALSQDGRRGVIMDRDIVAPALWLATLE